MACAAACPRRWWPITLAALALAAVAGCKKQPQIARYQAPKEQTAAPTATRATDDANGADRMLAAVVPHGDTAWFFKLAGPADAVGRHADALEQLVKSITFNVQDGKPQWTLPAGWQQKPGSSASSSAVRFATLAIGPAEPPLEVSITTLPWSPADDRRQMLANVNRWRGQMSRAPLEAADLPNETRSLKLKDGQATLVDIRGAFSTGGMQPPFAKAAVPQPVTKTPQPQSAPISEPTSDQSAQLPFSCEAPDSWNSSPPPAFAVLAFTVRHDSNKVEITVTPLGAGGGGMLSNVNRWRSQVKLPLISEDELAGLVKPYKVDGLPAHLVNIVGPEQGAPRMSIVVAVVPRGDTTWFFRMRGDAAAAEREMANFEKFLGSIKFRGGEL